MTRLILGNTENLPYYCPINKHSCSVLFAFSDLLIVGPKERNMCIMSTTSFNHMVAHDDNYISQGQASNTQTQRANTI